MGTLENYKKMSLQDESFVGAYLLTISTNEEKALNDFINNNKIDNDFFCYNWVKSFDTLKGFIGENCIVYPDRVIKLKDKEYLLLTEKVNGLFNNKDTLAWFRGLSIVEKYDIMLKYMDMFVSFHSSKDGSTDFSFVHHRIQPQNLFIKDENKREVGVFLPSKLKTNNKRTSSGFPGDNFRYAAPENWNIEDVNTEILKENDFKNIDKIFKGDIVSGVEGDVYSLAVTLMVLMSSEEKIFNKIDKSCFKNDNYDTCLSNLSENIFKVFKDQRLDSLASPFTTATNSLPHKRYQSMHDFRKRVLFTFCTKMFNEKVEFGKSQMAPTYVRNINSIADPNINETQKEILNKVCIQEYDQKMTEPNRILI